MTQIISALIPVIAALAPVISALTPLVEALADMIAAILVPALEAIAPIIEDYVAPLIEWLSGLIATNVRMITAIMTGDWSEAWNAAKEIVAKVASGIGGLISGLVSAAVATIGRWAADMVARVQRMWNDTVNAVSGGVGRVVEWVRGLPGKLRSALGNVGSLLVAAGRSIINGLLAGLKAAWGGVTNFVGGIADWIARNKGPISYDYNLLKPAAKAIMGGFYDTLDAGFRDVQGLVSTFAPTISANVTSDTVSSNDQAAAAGTVVSVQVENMHVRSDSDIRRIAQGIADLTEAKGRASGNLALGVSG